jgi:lipopolysaccharide transport system ATP-binding protein
MISVEQLSKRYLVGHRAERNRQRGDYNLRDAIVREFRNAARKAADMARGRQIVQGDSIEEFIALRDVSFTVNEGEVLGIIGRNGAGKSTLLKILSRITEPTTGRVVLRGRVASLLEVGTGFHPELSGRENIYLNGAILGMSRAEIRRKFDEIIAFAEVEKFIDTPVKRYSSGMYVRLAFAVAAHLEPEILIVDEVLAVGDTEFQKKCLGKISEVAKEGRTVLFVSHNLAAIANLAKRALLLNAGSITVDSSVEEVVSTYLSKGERKTSYIHPFDLEVNSPHIARVELLTSDAGAVHRFGEPLEIKFWIRHQVPMRHASFCFQIYNQFQIPVILSSYYREASFGSTAGSSVIVCRFPRLLLNVGQFHLRTWLQEGIQGGDVYETLDGICAFEVVRIDKVEFLGWRPEVCTYHEQHAWTAVDVPAM